MKLRDPDIITQEIQDLDSIILSANELSNQFPHDNLLRMNVSQSEHRKENLLRELEASLELYGRHSIKYIFKEVSNSIKVETFTDNLNAFKKIIDKTFEKITEGKSNNIPVYINAFFRGSYGIQLTTPFEEELFDQKYDKALNETFTVFLDLVSVDEIQINDVLEKNFGNDRSLLNKYSIFFKKVHQYNKEIHIEWKSPNTKKTLKTSITPEKANSLYNFFSKKESTEEEVELLGILKGLSLIRYKVEFISDPDGKAFITAKFDEKLTEEVIDSIDKYVYAKFSVTSKYNEAKDQLEKFYELNSIYKRD
ncbi:MAG: hypothetical protein WD449_01895 [Candidatus Babeliales bacterium]